MSRLFYPKEIMKNEKAMKRVKKSYQMMLDFYGMECDESGKVKRAEKIWKKRFEHLNRFVYLF